MVIEITWNMVLAAAAGVSLIGVGIGTLSFHAVKAYRKARGLDKTEANAQMEQIIQNYKGLYESQQELFEAEREKTRHQNEIFEAEINGLKADVIDLRAEVSRYHTTNSNLQSLLCPHRATCPWTKTEGGPPSKA